MEQVIKSYGKFLIEGIVLVVLLTLLFFGIRDDAGNQGVFRVVGARLPTNGIDYESYRDYDAYHTESGRTNPKIEFGGGSIAAGTVKLSDHIYAADYAGRSLQIKVMEIIAPDGNDITGALNTDTTEISLDVPGIYSVKLRSIDGGGRRSVCTMEIPVSGG